MGNAVYVAIETGSSEIDGEHFTFQKGETRVREGHPLLDHCPDLFKPADEDVTFDVETATNSPRGKRRGPKKDETPKVVVPDGVIPGETPGWPIDAKTGEPLALSDEQRAELAKVELESAPETAPGKAGDETPEEDDLSEKTRADLNELAAELGVENPKKIAGGKPAVIAAIQAARKAE